MSFEMASDAANSAPSWSLLGRASNGRTDLVMTRWDSVGIAELGTINKRLVDAKDSAADSDTDTDTAPIPRLMATASPRTGTVTMSMPMSAERPAIMSSSARFFNTAGPCRAEVHYILPAEVQVPELLHQVQAEP